jgi:zinc transport system ATP-binding protein
MSAPLLQVSDLTVRSGGRLLVDSVSFDIGPGEVVIVVGPNGGGKTTLIRAILGITPISAGAVTRRAGLRIGYSPQRLAIERSMPVKVSRFLALAGHYPQPALASVLDRTGISDLAETFMTDLSGGELQRVLLARALLRSPDLLILDEPTQGLDQPGEEHFYTLLSEIRAEKGTAVLMVSHDLHVVMAGSDRVICLNGHVCCSGAPEAVSVDPSFLELFGHRAGLALYQHHHDHSHDHHGHAHG